MTNLDLLLFFAEYKIAIGVVCVLVLVCTIMLGGILWGTVRLIAAIILVLASGVPMVISTPTEPTTLHNSFE